MLGNPSAFDVFAYKWLNLAENFINVKNPSYAFLFEHCCAIIYLCLKKLNVKKRIDYKLYMLILKETSDVYLENNWSVILVKYLFKDFFLELIFKQSRYFDEEFSISKRILFLNILNSSLNLITTEVELKYLLNFFTKLSNDFLEYFIKNENLFNNFEELNDLMRELKNALICLNDLLSENENESKYREITQEYENVVRNSCLILNKVHTNNLIKERFNKELKKNENINELTDGYVNLKLELIRLIGILVYENEFNRNIVQETQALISIIENVNIDIYNPFIREWSIVTLRHLYYAKELKN